MGLLHSWFDFGNRFDVAGMPRLILHGNRLFDVPRIDWEAYVNRLCDCPTFLVLLVHEDALGIAFKNEKDTPWCCQT